jgi:hypothetical protein
MSGTLKINGALVLGRLASAPLNPEPGTIYFNTVDGEYKFYENGQFRAISAEELAGVAGDLSAHLDGGANKHDASEIDYERADIDRKNIDAASDDVEAALSDLDDAIGALDATPTNYTPVDASIVASHLEAIDAAIADSSGDAANITYTPAVVTDWDGDLDPGNVDDALDQLAERVDDNELAIADKAESSVVSEIDQNVDDLITLSGVAENATDLGTFTGSTITDNSTVKTALQELETEVEAKIDSADVGEPNGVAALDGNGKVPLAQLPNSIMEYKGTYNATTNTPALADGAGNDDTAIGDVYRVTVAGTQDFGSGNITFEVGDYVILNDSKIWEKAQTSEIVGGVSSVNGEVGDVVLDSSDLDHTQATPANWTVTDGDPVSGHLDELASRTQTLEDAGYITAVVDDTSPELGGDLEVGANAIEAAANPVLLAGQDSVRRAKQASKSNFIEEEYIHAIALSASQTGTVIAALTVAHAAVEGMEITYKIKEATSDDIRIGTLRVVTNGSDVSINDIYTETGLVDVDFSAAINGTDLEISYNSGSNAATMRADVKKILA